MPRQRRYIVTDEDKRRHVVFSNRTPLASEIREPTQAEMEEQVRDERDQLLQESDWTQLPDAPLTVATVALWAIYRQALRDITLQIGFPFLVIWPTKPEG